MIPMYKAVKDSFVRQALIDLQGLPQQKPSERREKILVALADYLPEVAERDWSTWDLLREVF